MDGHPLWVPAKPAIIRPAEPSLIKPKKFIKGNLNVNHLIGFGAGGDFQTTGNDSFTKVLLHFDGADASTTITDSNAGGNAHTWTASGNAQIDTAQSKFGGASLLGDGTGDFVSTPDSSDLVPPGDYTIDCWIRPNSVVGNHCVVSKSPSDFFGPYIIRNEAGTLTFYSSSNGTSHNIANAVTFGTVSTGTWYHIAVTRAGDTYRLFQDGTQNATFSSSLTPISEATSLMVGRLFNTNDFNGWIDEFRLSHTARWTANFTPPTVAYS